MANFPKFMSKINLKIYWLVVLNDYALYVWKIMLYSQLFFVATECEHEPYKGKMKGLVETRQIRIHDACSEEKYIQNLTTGVFEPSPRPI